MKRFALGGLAVGLVIMLSASVASAACLQSDLKGTWRLYITGADDVGMFWVRCTSIVVKLGGGIGSGAACVSDENATVTITGGSLTLSSDCLITGTLRVDDGPGPAFTATVVQGALDRGKAVAKGVGRAADVGSFTFDMVKR